MSPAFIPLVPAPVAGGRSRERHCRGNAHSAFCRRPSLEGRQDFRRPAVASCAQRLHGRACDRLARLFGHAINRRVKRLYLRLGARPLPDLIHPLATMITFADVADAMRNPVQKYMSTRPA